MSDQTAAPAIICPTTGSERISSLDVLRGVAILGILVMNIYAFAMPFPAYSNPLLMGGTDALNMATWFVTHILFDQKFLSLFAMLFGVGIALMTERVAARGAKPGRIFFRRQLVLMLFGALHAYLIWFGDILFMYAVVGMLAYLFRHRTSRTLIVVACLLLPVALLLSAGIGKQMQAVQTKAADVVALQDAGEALSARQQDILEDWESQQSFMAPDADTVREDLAVHEGGYAGIMAYRVPIAMQMQVFGTVFFGLWRVTALMLIGMVLFRTGVLTAEKSADWYRRMMLICYGAGLPLTAYSAIDLHAHQFNAMYAFGAGGVANYFGSIIVALGHVALVMLLIRTGFVQRLLARFAAAGRMALTNYLMHSVILTTVFYGYGLGLYGDIPRFGQMGFVLAVIALQLALSPWWLARYRFGPVEWLWRSLTYWQRQPMKRE